MSRFRVSRFLLSVAISLFFSGAVVFMFHQNSIVQDYVISPVTRFLRPVSNVFARPIALGVSFFDDFFHIDEIRAENLSYKEELLALDNVQAKLSDLEADNKALKASLKLKEENSESYITTAQVISRPTVSWLANVTIDQGTSAGIQKGMLAVSNGTLVGIVKDTNANSSVVSLLTDTGAQTAIPVKLEGENGPVFGVLTGYDIKSQELVISKLNEDDSIKEKSKVLTSGLDGASVANVTVGSVTRTENKGVNKLVYVQSVADFSTLRYLSILGNK